MCMTTVSHIYTHIRRCLQRSQGFTLVETIIYIAVFFIVMTALAVTISYTYRAGRFVYEQADALNEVRKGMETMVQALRESAYADNGAYPLVSMSADSVTVYSDTDNDGSAERITFTIQNNELAKKVLPASGNPPVYTGTETTTSVAQFVRNTDLSIPLFTYYDADGNEVTDYTQLSRVESIYIRLFVNIYPSRAPDDYELRSRASFRNAR